MAKDERAQFDATIVGDARGGVRVKIRIGDVLPWAEHPADCAMPCIGYPTMGSAESIRAQNNGAFNEFEDLRQPTSSRTDLNPQGGLLAAAVVES